LARHFLEARITEKALYYLQQAGERAFQVSAYQEAISHHKKGLDLLATLPDFDAYAHQELSLQLTYSMAYNLALGHVGPEMERASYRALELSQKVGDIKQHFKALNILSILHYVKGEFDLAYERAEESLVLARQAEDPLLIALAQWCQGIALLGFGDFELARYNFEQVIAMYEPQLHHRAIVTFRGIDAGLSSLAYLAICLWYLGYPEQAVAKSQEARELAYQLDHSFTLADVLRYGCCEVDKLRRNAPSLRAHAEELIRLAQEKNISSWYSAGLSCLGESLILTGRIQTGITLAQEGVNGNLSTGVRCSIPGPLLYLTEAYARMGDLEQGEKTWNEVCELIETTGERRWEGELYRMRAILQQMRGGDQDAEASLKKALEIAHKQSARLVELRAAIDLAHLLEKQGRTKEGLRLVKGIFSWFTEGFDTPELKEARELCAENLNG
jgi:tetratricopeptide (TPR) repeat protein